MDDCYRLSFLLPTVLRLGVLPGRHQPCVAGCVLIIHHTGLITIDGPSRERVFDQARRFLRMQARGHGPLSIAAVLISPLPPHVGRHGCGGRGGRDGWSIIVGAEIAFAPTSIPPDIGNEQTTAVG